MGTQNCSAHMQGNQASSRSEGEGSWFLSSSGANLGYILELQQGWQLKTHVCLVTSGLLSSYEGHLRNLFQAWQGNRDAFRCEEGDQGPFPVATVILGFLSILRRNQALSHFEALNSACPLKCQRDVRPLVDMR